MPRCFADSSICAQALWHLHWLNREVAGKLGFKLLAKSAFFDVPNVKPFGHLGGDIAPTVTDSIADLKYVQLIKALHVCIIDVAAMADMTRIAISAFLLKQRNVWAL